MGAAALIPMTIMIGGALDMSIAYMARAKLQNACDSAVLAGRQSMEGASWKNKNKKEAKRFFDFNFPAGAHGAKNLTFDIDQNEDDTQELVASASAEIPTAIMKIFGYDTIPIEVDCDAKRDQGHNDIVLVLDVTGSMNDAPSGGGASKISRLRTGATGLYRALADDGGSQTRYGIVPYSHTVNVGRSLKNKDILREQEYVDIQCNRWGCWLATKTVHINSSSWNNVTGNAAGNTQAFRTSGDACIEERPTVGNSDSPIEIEDFVTRDDIDKLAGNAGNEPELQFGRYDPAIQEGESQSDCPSEASKLQEYASETAFNSAINAATARVTGGTYHDIGLLWGARFLSRTGFFSADNPTEIDDIPVRQHIVFMTDGMLDTGDRLYSAHGIERYQGRTQGSGTQNANHLARFASACAQARAMKRLLRSLARRDDGIAATEFGLILVPLMVLLMGGLDLSHQAYIRSVLQGALSDAARKAAVEDPGFVASGDTLEERIENTISAQVDSVAPDATYKIEIENFYEFSGIGNPEKLVTDVDGNGQYDEGDGDCFEDLNDNGTFDLDSGRSGVGGANDVVFYQAQVTLPRLLPVAGLIGMGDTMELNAEAAVRNQPYDSQASVPTVCGEPD